MAKERKIPTFTPDQLEQIEGIKRKVLEEQNSAPATKPSDEAPRQIMPLWYCNGGLVPRVTGKMTSRRSL